MMKSSQCLNVGDKVKIYNHSYMAEITQNKVKEFCTTNFNETWTIVALNCDLPGTYSYGINERNDTILCRDRDNKVVFVKQRFLISGW